MKYGRQLSDVQTRMRLKASGDKFEIRQNYIPTLNDRIFGELEKVSNAMVLYLCNLN
jgi:replication factor C subunit 1